MWICDEGLIFDKIAVFTKDCDILVYKSLPFNSQMVIFIKIRKCGVDIRLLSRRLWKDPTKTNATMPHTWIVWVYAQIVHSRIAIQEMSAVRFSIGLENFHIFYLGVRKTLSICLLLRRIALQN